jgi:hypothetical protein
MQHANASTGHAAPPQNTAQRKLRISGVPSHQFQPNEGSHHLCSKNEAINMPGASYISASMVQQDKHAGPPSKIQAPFSASPTSFFSL